MKECLDHREPFTPNMSKMEWQGSHSQRFKLGRAHFSPGDSFYAGTTLTKQQWEPHTGRRHILRGETDYISPRSTIRVYNQSDLPPWEKHRQQGKKITQFEPLPIKPRAQKLHIYDNRPQITKDQLPIGLRTFYDNNIYSETAKDYRVQDRMQRKIRAPARLNNTTFYGHMPWLDKEAPVPYHEDFGLSRTRLRRSSFAQNNSSFSHRDRTPSYSLKTAR